MTVAEVIPAYASPKMSHVMNSPTSSEEGSPHTPCDVMSPVNKECIKLHGNTSTGTRMRRNTFVADEIDYTVNMEMNTETSTPLLRRLKKQGSIGSLLLQTQSLTETKDDKKEVRKN